MPNACVMVRYEYAPDDGRPPMNCSLDLCPDLLSCHIEFIPLLQVQPKRGLDPEPLLQSQRRVGRRSNNGTEPNADQYVGTLVGESTSREFRLAVAHESIREQDIIAVDAELRPPDPTHQAEQIRVWAKVQRIERMNPLFPTEAGHELAANRTNPLDTVLSLSREMVTAVCQVLGAERRDGEMKGKLDHLRYPAKPATTAYRPNSEDIARIVAGDLQDAKHAKRALDIATLSNRPEVDVKVDGHAIVTRHLAILAMTGAGKSWAARRIIEQLAERNYPIVIFDPHGDYSGLADVPELARRVHRYYARFPVFEQEPEAVMAVVESLGWPLAKTHRERFEGLFLAVKTFISVPPEHVRERAEWLSEYLGNPSIKNYGLLPDLYCFAHFVQALVTASKADHTDALGLLSEWSGDSDQVPLSKKEAGWLESFPANLRSAAKQLRTMEAVSRKAARTSVPLPNDRTSLVSYGQISVVALAGYRDEFRATIY